MIVSSTVGSFDEEVGGGGEGGGEKLFEIDWLFVIGLNKLSELPTAAGLFNYTVRLKRQWYKNEERVFLKGPTFVVGGCRRCCCVPGASAVGAAAGQTALLVQ